MSKKKREKRTVIEARQHRGRPRAGEHLPQRESWRVKLALEEDPERLSQSREKLNKFILVTNILDCTGMTNTEILKAYKGQSAVETNFKWAKNPAAVAPIFLKDPKRIAVLGFVYLVALMVYTLMQRQIRQSLKQAQKTIPGNKGYTDNPTGRVLFQNMRGIAVVVISLGKSILKQITNFTQLHTDILRYFSFDGEIYQPLKTISSA
ncbi:MAG: IS1634 family transposase [Candidatus Jettenia sp.]|nr:MAG: IS1634 family transposase [Candidatus Jettenia sp.]